MSNALTLWSELKRRRVVRAEIAYGAAAFGVLQAVQLVFDALILPDFAFRFLEILALAGFPIVFVLAWVYDVTAEGLRKTGSGEEGVVGRERVPLRRWLQVAGLFLMVAVLATCTAAGIGRLRFPAAADDGRVGVAIFPFRVSGSTDTAWSEGAADLLATALDGAVGLRVVDPWSLWQRLRPTREDPARAPDPEQAEEIAQSVGAHRYMLASVVPSGDLIQLNVRLYQIGRVEPISAFVVSGDAASMAQVVRSAAVGVLARVWGDLRAPNVPPELDFDATDSPEALKAYLSAKDAFRRGDLELANATVDESIALDSTFVLALADAVTIKSWGSFARGQPYSGLSELLARAEALADSSRTRTRLRLEAIRALLDTDGPRADAVARRILEIDPHDFAAHELLAHTQMVYGWQYGITPDQARNQAEQVLALDPRSLTALTRRASLAIALSDTADQRTQIERLARVDTVSTLGRAWFTALRMELATEAEFVATLPTLTAVPPPVRVTVYIVLRASRPARAAAYLHALRETTDPGAKAMAEGELARLAIVGGRAASVDSAIAAGAFRQNETFRRLQALIVSAALAGIDEERVTRRAADALASYVNPDEALSQYESRPVWWFGWLVGAYHATAGDTVVARRWIDAIGSFPPGGTPPDFPLALQADIRARLAMRAGDSRRALEEARAAYRIWSVHDESQIESLPEPAMRFHLAMLLLRAGETDEARRLFSSLVMPATWMGVLTARASLELGELYTAAGDDAMATVHYARARQLWEGAGPGAAPWLQRVNERLAGS